MANTDGRSLDRKLGEHVVIDSGNIPNDVIIEADIGENSISNEQMKLGAFPKIVGVGPLATELELVDVDIVTGVGTGTKIGTDATQKLAFWDATPVVQQTSLPSAETTITFVDENTPDFALASLKLHSDDTGAGFADLNEAQAFVEVVANLQARLADLETKLTTLGILAS